MIEVMGIIIIVTFLFICYAIYENSQVKKRTEVYLKKMRKE